jgi:TRAP-type C4-dicarboxylate transport system substrate-binding protein
LSYAWFQPPIGLDAELIQWWADEVAKRTDGAVTIKIYWGGTLAQFPEIPEAVRTGTADIGDFMWSLAPGRLSFYSMFDEPFGFWNKPLAAWLAAEQVAQETPEFQEILAENNVRRLTYYGMGVFHVISKNKAIRTLDDFQGVKVRGSGSSQVLVSAVGATPVSLSGTQDYDNIQKGVIDASMETVNQLYWWKTHEVVNYVTKVGCWGNPNAGAMINLDVWNQLSPEVQQILDDLREEFVLKTAEEQLKETLDPGWAGLEELGLEIIELSPEEMETWKNKPAVKALPESYVEKRADVLGIPAPRLKEILDRFMDLSAELAEQYPEEW